VVVGGGVGRARRIVIVAGAGREERGGGDHCRQWSGFMVSS
jgi:hypothetical protein